MSIARVQGGGTIRPRMVLKLAAILLAAAFILWIGVNIAANMAARGMTFSYAFLESPFGVDLSFFILPWRPGETHLYALAVALVNTIFVSTIAIALASLLGLLLGLMRLSSNPLASGTAYVVIEVVRNVPLLTQVIFIYIGVLQYLPPPRASFIPLPNVYMNVRGLFVPVPQLGLGWIAVVFGIAAIAALLLSSFRYRFRMAAALLVVGIIAFAFVPWDKPQLRGFSFAGGWLLTPELLALWFGVSLYVSAFIAEIVRSAIGGVATGQCEAAASLGLHKVQETYLIVLPQALRAMIPPLTNQYLNVVKATTLGAAIAFPEVVQVFARSIMNQTGRSVEIMLLILAIYVTLNTSFATCMNLLNRRLAIPTR